LEILGSKEIRKTKLILILKFIKAISDVNFNNGKPFSFNHYVNFCIFRLHQHQKCIAFFEEKNRQLFSEKALASKQASLNNLNILIFSVDFINHFINFNWELQYDVLHLGNPTSIHVFDTFDLENNLNRD
jgi:hypothetical protein